MQHEERCGDLELDHFDPRKKKDKKQFYNNLFLSSAKCNKHKWANWPSADQENLGYRFIDPTIEWDYGPHIQEDQETGRVIGLTRSGRYQVRMMRLNHRLLVAERKQRTEYLEELNRPPDRAQDSTRASFQAEVEKMVPPIEFYKYDSQ